MSSSPPPSDNQALVPAPTTALTAEQQYWNLGLACSARGEWKAAALAFARAARAAPRDGLYWLNLAHSLRHANHLPGAVAAARRCLRVDPKQHLALRLQGECLYLMHRYEEACAAYQALEALGEPDPEAMLQHASILMRQFRSAEAAQITLRALTLRPEYAGAYGVLSGALCDGGLKREAVECLRTVVALEPDNLEARIRVLFERHHVCDWDGLDAELSELASKLALLPLQPGRRMASFASLSLPLTPELQLRASRLEALTYAEVSRPLPPPAARPAAGARIRLGFLSYDFREHPVSQLIVEMIEGLDRRRFEVLLYSIGPDDNSSLGLRMRGAGDQFVDLRGMGDAEAAARIRADGVEILLDLMGHTRGNRLAILAHRPAPLQVAYLGYPASTGAAFIDYLIGDPEVTPLELAHLYTEKLAQMPLTFQPNGRWRPLPQPMARQQAGLPEQAFVMCAFNHTYKIGPEAFDTWCGVMRDVPHAVLWLKETSSQLHDNVRREAALRGVDPLRVIFAPTVGFADHFSRLALADVFIDTWPYNAHTTAADALWAGAPVLTGYGNAFASRVAASVLHAAGMPELAFASADEYRRAITVLALEPQLLAGYRQQLQQQRMQLALFDTPTYTRDFERLLQRMSARWRAGQACAHLPAMAQPQVEAAGACLPNTERGLRGTCLA